MKIMYDEDEYETVISSRACTTCGGDRKKCDGSCNGHFGMSQVRRPPDEVKKIKAERERKRQDAVLAEADLIRARRL